MKTTDFFQTYRLPSWDSLFATVSSTLSILHSELEEIRPKDNSGHSGALLRTTTFPKTPIPTILVPDLHARTDFFTEICNFKLPKDVLGDEMIIQNALEQGKLFLICLGDGVHSERRAIERWLEAQKEWLAGNILNKAMCEEMSESLSLMMMVMQTKCAYPNYFHFLKGNHENILNELGRGNYPFRKFAMEGEMSKQFMHSLYGEPLVKKYAELEHQLPLFVHGSNFLASHAEPIIPFSEKELINGLLDEVVISGLTWTKNDEAQVNSVQNMLKNFFPDRSDTIYFIGHRSIKESYRLLKNNRLIQIHNPEQHLISLIRPDRPFNPKTDIYDTSLGGIAQKIGETTDG